MRNFYKIMAMATVAVAAAVFTGCSSDDDFISQYDNAQAPLSRAAITSDRTVITFDDFTSGMAMPTSYGANYYGQAGSYAQVEEIYDPDGVFMAGVNYINGVHAFYNGGIALSKWNLRSNPTDMSSVSHADGIKELPADWWYSYHNQMSVYNTNSADGANVGAGHSGNNFAVVYGYKDAYNSTWMDQPAFYLDNEYRLEGLWFCNSSYTYGVMMNGNKFGNIGVAGSMPETNGYFQVELECYDMNGNLVKKEIKLLADYRSGHTKVTPVDKWTYWPLGVDGVASVKFNFTGSDTGSYGLNTPAYFCIDDIVLK